MGYRAARYCLPLLTLTPKISRLRISSGAARIRRSRAKTFICAPARLACHGLATAEDDLKSIASTRVATLAAQSTISCARSTERALEHAATNRPTVL